jgi:hypothetical protein
MKQQPKISQVQPSRYDNIVSYSTSKTTYELFIFSELYLFHDKLLIVCWKKLILNAHFFRRNICLLFGHLILLVWLYSIYFSFGINFLLYLLVFLLLFIFFWLGFFYSLELFNFIKLSVKFYFLDRGCY